MFLLGSRSMKLGQLVDNNVLSPIFKLYSYSVLPQQVARAAPCIIQEIVRSRVTPDVPGRQDPIYPPS
jgi:hypothetical protein